MQTNWDIRKLFSRQNFKILDSSGNICRILYENEPYHDRDTEVFAYLGKPDTGGKKVPGMVCVHGGGGKAYLEWVRMWVDKGYAAIAMDLSGRGDDGERLAKPGPEQDSKAKFNVDAGWRNLWTYHAIAAVIRGHTILRNFSGVDPNRTGITGISWGGYLTCIAAGLDSRFSCAIPVYGCGFLQDNSAEEWMKIFSAMSPEKKKFWHDKCDPSMYLSEAKMPMLFISGTNDHAYPLDILKKTYSLPKGPVHLCVRIEMPHGHIAGWSPCEISVFTDSLFMEKPALPGFTSVALQDRKVKAMFSGESRVKNGFIVYTTDTGRWQERKWRAISLKTEKSRMDGKLPEGTSAYFLAVEDERGAYTSTPHEEVRDQSHARNSASAGAEGEKKRTRREALMKKHATHTFSGATIAGALSREMLPLPGSAVKLRGEIGRRIELTITSNLLKLDIERDFISPLNRKNGAYVGIGLLLKAATQFAAYSEDARVAAVRDRIAGELVRLQEPDGYVGYKSPDCRLWELFDPDEIAQIILGLVTHYEFTKEESSLSAARKLAGFVIRECRTYPEKASPSRRSGLADILTWISIEWAMIRLHEISGDQDPLDFCIRDRKLVEWNDPIVRGRWGRVEGHVYGYLVRCFAQLRLHRIEARAALLEPTRRALEFMTREDGQVITGAVSDIECWHDSQDGGWTLGETCAEAYLLNMLDELLRREKVSFYGDIMERVIYNTLFAAQSPDGRRLRYYTAFEGPRSYWNNDFYCCPNNFRRIISELPGMACYCVDDGVAINLYNACTIDTHVADNVALTLRQETDYPGSGVINIYLGLARSAKFPLWLRIPRWCAAAKVKVNGRQIRQTVTSGTFLLIRREWHPNDLVQLELPMSWRWIRGRQAQTGRVALMRGPVLFCLNPASCPELAGANLRQLTIIPKTVEGPFIDNSIRPGGCMARVQAWKPGVHVNIGLAKPDLTLELTEFPDPGGEVTYFCVPNPSDPRLVADELFASDARI